MHSNFVKKNWVIIAAIILHLAVIGLPFVNLEWAFSEAAHYFTTHDYYYLDQYFSNQANTLTLPALSAGFSKLLPFIDISYFPRLFAAGSYILLGIAIRKMTRILFNTDKDSNLYMILVFLNPLIWIFGGRGTADFFPAAIGIFGLALYWSHANSKMKQIFAILSLSLSILLKYHAVFLLVPLAIEIFLRPAKI